MNYYDSQNDFKQRNFKLTSNHNFGPLRLVSQPCVSCHNLSFKSKVILYESWVYNKFTGLNPIKWLIYQ